MTACATCGRRLDHERSQRVCPSCTWHAALRRQTATDAATPDRPVAMAARLHDLALIVGERLNPGAIEMLESVARGNVLVYETEVSRLANRYVDHLEETWEQQ